VPGAADVGKPIRLRLTVDAQGRIVRVELLAGDRGAESCLRKAFRAWCPPPAAQGGPAGTVEITVQAKR
jgi:TonB family protein